MGGYSVDAWVGLQRFIERVVDDLDIEVINSADRVILHVKEGVIEYFKNDIYFGSCKNSIFEDVRSYFDENSGNSVILNPMEIMTCKPFANRR